MDWEPTNAVKLTMAALKKDNEKLKGKARQVGLQVGARRTRR